MAPRKVMAGHTIYTWQTAGSKEPHLAGEYQNVKTKAFLDCLKLILPARLSEAAWNSLVLTHCEHEGHSVYLVFL